MAAVGHLGFMQIMKTSNLKSNIGNELYTKKTHTKRRHYTSFYDKSFKSYVANMAAGGHLGFMQIRKIKFEK